MRNDIVEKITQLRHHLHAHPALSLQEKKTKEALKAFLKENASNLLIEDRGHWFYLLKPSEKKKYPPMAFRADMDALPIEENLDCSYSSTVPGISHKCGHDGHCAALCGLAMELNEADDLGFDIYLIFQHAEEVGKGAQECVQLIEEKKISEIFAFHNLGGFPQGSIVVRRGLTQPASKGLTIHFEGKTSHASNPEEGKNPTFAIGKIIALIEEELHREHDGMLLCTAVNVQVGSKNFGVSAGEGEISMTLRAENESEMEELENLLRDKAKDLAKNGGFFVSFTEDDPFPETRNHDESLDKVVAVAKEQNRKVVFMPELWRASEDFGWYLKKCKGAIFYIGNGEDYPPLHTVSYDFVDENLEVAKDIFLGLIQNHSSNFL